MKIQLNAFRTYNHPYVFRKVTASPNQTIHMLASLF